MFTLITDLKHVKELKSGTCHSLVVAGFCEGFFCVVCVYCNKAKCLFLIEVGGVWNSHAFFFLTACTNYILHTMVQPVRQSDLWLKKKTLPVFLGVRGGSK